MIDLREAAQMALEALQESKPIDIDDPATFYRSAHAIEALRSALAQPEQEPTRSQKMRDAGITRRPKGWNKEQECRNDGRCQYAIDHGAEGMGHCPKGQCCMPKAQPEQEPEPYCYTWDVWISGGYWEARYGWEPYCGGKRPAHSTEAKPLYTAPPQRKFIGLTDEEIEDACWTEVDQRMRSFARAIEAKLREKNHG